MTPKLHLGKYFRYLWEEKDLLVVEGRFAEVAVSRQLYEAQYPIADRPGEADRVLVPLMGAAALAAVSLADRESWGWTITFEDDPLGYFVGVEPEGMICGSARAAESEKRSAYVQRQQPKGKMTQSYFEPVSSDPVAAVARYFDQTVQVKTRIAVTDDASGVLVQALPGGRFEAVADLDSPALVAMCRELISADALKPVGEVLIFYDCRCNDEMILNMITSLPEAQRREVWGEETHLDVECPRCGRRYEIQRPFH